MGQLGAGAGLGSQLLGKTRLFLVGSGRKEFFAFLGDFEGLWKLIGRMIFPHLLGEAVPPGIIVFVC